MDYFPIDISFRNMVHSNSAEANIRKKFATMEQFFDRIVDCRVAVSVPHKHSQKGGCYDVHIKISIPGQDNLINRTVPRDLTHEGVYVAIRDAIGVTVWKLEDHIRKARGEVKRHANDQ